MSAVLPRAAALAAALAVSLCAQESRPRPDLVLVGLHGGVAERLIPAFALHGLFAVATDVDALAADPAPLYAAKVALLQHLNGERRAAFGRALAEAVRRDPPLRAYGLSASATANAASRPGAPGAAVAEDARLAAYYAGSSDENLRRLAAYVAKERFGRDAEVLPPLPATVSVTHPDAENPFPDAPTFLAWARARRPALAAAPRAAVVAHTTHLAFQQPEVVRAIVAALERRGLLAGVFVDSGEGLTALRGRYEANLLAFAPDVVVHTCHAVDTVAFREKLDVPHLHSVFLGRDSIAAWRANPVGLDGRTLAFQILTQEPLGAVEPIVAAGTPHGRGGGEAMTPVEDGVERLAARAARWSALRRKPNAEKRVAIVYYDRELDPASLMRGSTTGMFMNAPRSTVATLARLAREGYRIDGGPPDEAALLARLKRGGRQIGLWAPDALETAVKEGAPALIPVADYVRRFEAEVPPERRAEIVARYGPPPGAIMTWKDPQGAEFIVVPRIDFGGVCLLPQPLRGEAHDPKALHDKSAPPPHNYLATYFWLRDGYGADAVVHFGTHGSEFLFSGKRSGLAGDDWCEILLGDLPNVCPWIVTNTGEVAWAKRRSHAVVVSHDGPPLVEAGLADELLTLHDDLEKLIALDAGPLKERFRESVSAGARKLGLTADLHAPPGDAPLGDAALVELDSYLHALREERTPTSLHVFGAPPPDDQLVPYVVACLKRKFLELLAPLVATPEGGATGPSSPAVRAAAERVVAAIVRNGRTNAEALAAARIRAPDPLPVGLKDALDLARELGLRMGRAGEELDGFVAALSGRFVKPGPGGSPARNPASIPGGRNLFLFNPEEIPAKPSFALGKKLVDDFLADFLRRRGRYPTRVAFSLNPSATFQDYGVLESQVLAALGCEPVWDEKNVVADVRVVPRAELGRPRVDVFLRGAPSYVDALGGRLTLIDRAIRAVAAADEEDNGVRKETARIAAELAAAGYDADRVRTLSTARIFGGSPDATSNADLYYRTERSGSWENRDELVDGYLSDFKYAYVEGAFGVEAADALRSAARGVDVVLRTWTDPVRSPLSDKYMWFHGGTLAAALGRLSGATPEFALVDVRDADRARTVAAEDAIAADFRARPFNRKWIEGMMREGYAGADQLAVVASNAFGWATMRPGSVRDDQWTRLKETLVDDALGLGLREFFERDNPHALQELTETLLESARKGYWNTDEATLRALASVHAASVAAHGAGHGLRGADNRGLDAMIARLTAPAPGAAGTPPAAAPAAAGSAVAATSSADAAPSPAPAAAPARPVVTGRRLAAAPTPDARAAADPAALGAAAVAAALFLCGFFSRRR